MADGNQVHAAWEREEILSLFDPSSGRLDRRIYDDEAIYRLELERIFARGWNFMCHESQIPNAGDYFINYIGEDQVIVVRDGEGQVNVLLNTCRHRGNALCRAEQGNAKSFVCSYHGWNYALNGDLIGVPGLKNYYRGDFDKSQHGLAKAAQVDSYLGFYFATLDPQAPPLHDFLGDVGRTGLGMAAAYGDVIVLDGIQKNVIDCNWKIAVDNLFDWYHVMYSHASANSTGFVDLAQILHPDSQLVILGEYGHGIGGPGIPKPMQDQLDQLSDAQREEVSKTMPFRLRPASAKDLMGATGVRSMGHPNIFPNLWITLNGTQLCLRLPRGPGATELWWFTVTPKEFSPEQRRAVVRTATHLFGPAGLLEQDDGENWSQSTRASRGIFSRSLDHTLQMGLGHDEAVAEPGGGAAIDTCISEHGQRWLYRSWTEWLAAKDWTDLKANHSAPPKGKV